MIRIISCTVQNSERKGGNKVPKESKEELMEASKIFEDF